MSERIEGLTVIFEEPLRENYAFKIKEAIELMHGVQIAEPHVVNDPPLKGAGL